MSTEETSPVLLALETSRSLGSVALGVGGDVLAQVFMEERGAHAEQIVPAVARTLDEAGYDREEIDGIVVGSGPGSFTGVRVAAATAKGLAFGLGRPVWALSSLAAAALGDRVPTAVTGPWNDAAAVELPVPEESDDAPRCVLFDARGTRVYTACYRVVDGRLEEILAPRATTVDAVLGAEIAAGTVFVGDGALRHHERIRAEGFGVLGPPSGIPTAASLLLSWSLRPDTPPLEDVGTWEPEYLKASSAERERLG
jgi:tRNA threonylcarbamoyladenosine biosynthesis protein TsaB